MRYCPMIRGACREDCALLLKYGQDKLCAIPMAAHELFIVAEEMTKAKAAEEMQGDGEQG